MSEAGLLRAMVRNYSRNNLWDHLDAEACTKAANKIDELTEKLIEQAAEIESLRISYDSACCLVAQLHEAVMGEIVGPHHGVVEDVRNKVARLEAALASEQQDYKEVEAMLHAERDDSQTLRDKVAEQAAVIEKLLLALEVADEASKDGEISTFNRAVKLRNEAHPNLDLDIDHIRALK